MSNPPPKTKQPNAIAQTLMNLVIVPLHLYLVPALAPRIARSVAAGISGKPIPVNAPSRNHHYLVLFYAFLSRFK